MSDTENQASYEDQPRPILCRGCQKKEEKGEENVFHCSSTITRDVVQEFHLRGNSCRDSCPFGLTPHIREKTPWLRWKPGLRGKKWRERKVVSVSIYTTRAPCLKFPFFRGTRSPCDRGLARRQYACVRQFAVSVRSCGNVRSGASLTLLARSHSGSAKLLLSRCPARIPRELN